MKDDEVVAVVCYGPPGGPHDRHVIREYLRVAGEGWRILPPLGMARIALTGAPLDYKVDWPAHGDRIELRCRHCRYHEKRRLDRGYGRTFPPFSAVFDTVAAAGKREISARLLVAVVDWPRPKAITAE